MAKTQTQAKGSGPTPCAYMVAEKRPFIQRTQTMTRRTGRKFAALCSKRTKKGESLPREIG